MKLQVTETTKNLNNKEDSTVSVFSFKDDKITEKLNYGMVFQAKIEKNSKTVEISLIRQISPEIFEAYETQTLHASNSVSFNDKSAYNTINATFKLVK